MTGKTHLVAGLCVSLAVSAYSLDSASGSMFLPYTTPWYVIPIGIGSGLAGSVFPDIDWHTSKIGQFFAPVSKVINMIFGHRTLFHAPLLFALIYGSIWFGFPNFIWYAFLFTAGAASHLFLDMFNSKGIPLFYPYEKHFNIMSLKTNGFGETLIRKILIGGSVAAGIAFLVKLFLRIRIFM